jgi:hypothetical protein
MAEQVKPIVAQDKRTAQQKHFDELYAVFFTFYQEALRNDPPPHEKVRLLLTAQFFDDVALQKIVTPIFSAFPSNLEDKRACARAAYFDALSLHNRTANMTFETVSEKEIHNKHA